MRVGSAAPGFGLLDYGLQLAGMEIVWHAEINPYANAVLRKHWPSVPNFGDLTTLDPERLPEFDLFVGGFPCKQTSVAAAISGNRVGLSGKDSGLWWHMLRIIAAVRPNGVLIENVAGVKTWAPTIQGGLADLGYTVLRSELSSAACGASHLRRRMFFYAYRDGKGLAFTRPKRPSPIEDESRAALARGFWRTDQSGVLRMDDGAPYRMERIIGVGNGVDVRVAYEIGRAIMAAHYGDAA